MSVGYYLDLQDSRLPAALTLFEGGQIHNDAKAKSDRLRVTEKCSLVIKKVTEEDAGRYLQTDQIRKYHSDSQVYLSVVTMTEHQDNDEVTLHCSVTTYGARRNSGKWLYQVRDGENVQTFRPQSSGLLRLIIVSVGLAALIISVVTVNMWTTAKENKTQLEDNIVSINIG
ncbi:Homogentisate 12-dioxygenase [Dissostichus eleginoides]|uniref:Homogentisate 12-dioxygenase n=1 Tax=Dissostichus eleginoides TaxID=100907 RepID=A0AAD9F5L4_DISEL|nr:Homogentisate 12-dioxygenase [Dissostichus eleginoides]